MKRRSALVGSLAALAAGTPARAQTPVDLQLVLAVDVSRSIDEIEAELQRRGYIEALTNDRVIDAILSGEHKRIAVCYTEWAGTHYQVVVLDWTVIDTPGAARRFAEKLAEAPRASQSWTAVGAALATAAAIAATAAFATAATVAAATAAAITTTAAAVTTATTVAAATTAAAVATTAATAVGRTRAARTEATAIAAAATTTATVATAAAATTGLTLDRFTDRDRAAIQQRAVHGLHGRGALVIGFHLEEREAAAAAGLAIHDHFRGCNGAELREGFLQTLRRDRIGQVAHKQFATHSRLWARGRIERSPARACWTDASKRFDDL